MQGNLDNMNKNVKTSWSLSIYVLVLFCISLIGLLITGLFAPVLHSVPKHAATLLLLCAQDIFVFVVPAIVVAYCINRKPWQQLCVNRAPSWHALVVVITVCVVSMPALNWIINWNEQLHLPASLHVVEQAMRDTEDAAAVMTRMLISETSFMSMICVLLVVGILAGLSEEFFFRGAMLRLTPSGGTSHLAVWGIAIVFSAFHVQFFGFFPRMILGAWLGYLLLWTRSLWVPIIAHALNNSLVVISSYLSNIHILEEGDLDHIGVPQDGSFPVIAVCSALCTAAIIATWRYCMRLHKKL